MIQAEKLFSSKLDTLLYLKNKLSASCILDVYSFTVNDFYRNIDVVCSNISTLFDGDVIIRSSASTEDQESTCAGHFVSVQHVNAQSREFIIKGIENIIASYKRDGLSDKEYIFVQHQLTNVILSGVALSVEPQLGKPYFLINCDESGSTNSVTSGKCNRYIYIARDLILSNSLESRLCKAFLEIERICLQKCLNIEFAVTESEKIYIFQVRRLKFEDFPVKYKEIIKRKNTYKTNYASNSVLLSDMAFWNPSEIIGDSPRPLTFSLYSNLVTEYAWNKGIAEIGYFPIPKQIMEKIGNKPYINLEIVFKALTPSNINVELREKLVNYYCDLLKSNKCLHDKIEFKIVFTCFDFNSLKKLSLLADFGFSAAEIATLSSELFQMTKKIIEEYNYWVAQDLTKLSKIESELNRCKEEINTHEGTDIVATIAYLLQLIRNYGIIPFARHARCAFIAQSLCHSLVDTGQITSEQLDTFMYGIDTVAKELQLDIQQYNNNQISKKTIEEKYGHLRANTYDITSLTYKEIGIDNIFRTSNIDCKHVEKCVEQLSVKFPKTNIDLAPFLKDAIVQREYFMFVFTKALSYTIELIQKLADLLHIAYDDMSYLSIEDILNISFPLKQSLAEIIEHNKVKFELDQNIILPPVITEAKDFDIIKIDKSIPNYITNKIVVGDVCILSNSSGERSKITGKILVIENADPGFDWIFAQGTMIGLITKYGGMASHMAIRCMEFGLPAAIGCGELIYDSVANAKQVRLNCLDKVVEII